MVTAAVLGKKFRSLTSRDNAKACLTTKLKNKLNENNVQEVITTITQAFEDSTKKGIEKKDKLKEEIQAKLGEKRLFKFTQTLLEEMIEALESRSIQIFIQTINRDHRDFKEFLEHTLNDTATVMDRALLDQPMWGIYFKEGDSQLLISPIIQLGDCLWIPAATCEIEMDNGDKLAPVDISRMLTPIMDLAYTKKQDRGSVEITGPKGGKYPCGQIYTAKKRDQFKEEEKKIELANGYVAELFVINKPKT
jgi:hypothetical protein